MHALLGGVLYMSGLVNVFVQLYVPDSESG